MTCPRCKGWGIPSVMDYSIDPCPECGVGMNKSPCNAQKLNKAIEITKGKARLYFDGVDFIRTDINGAFVGMKLTHDERVKLIASLLGSIGER